jgi:3-deoxy-manno-octulosonate cytidylyltransferase (CMP-KDO synthetase)
MKTAIVIPARYGSTRFPGKPLVKIGGRTMLERVVDVGRAAAKGLKDVRVLVATEDARIDDYCKTIGVDCAMTSPDCPTGSDRVLDAAQAAGGKFDFLISLQGDAPFTPVAAIRALIETAQANPLLEVVTPVVRLRWSELDALRTSKQKTPFSGTTAVVDRKGFAVWFSKNILPAIRKEDALRKADEFSPVRQHLGLYGYRTDVLKRFVKLPQGYYEQLEGLEQLRFLENGITVRAVEIAVDAGLAQAGIDSPEDLERAEALVKKLGL